MQGRSQKGIGFHVLLFLMSMCIIVIYRVVARRYVVIAWTSLLVLLFWYCGGYVYACWYYEKGGISIEGNKDCRGKRDCYLGYFVVTKVTHIATVTKFESLCDLRVI